MKEEIKNSLHFIKECGYLDVFSDTNKILHRLIEESSLNKLTPFGDLITDGFRMNRSEPFTQTRPEAFQFLTAAGLSVFQIIATGDDKWWVTLAKRDIDLDFF